MTIKKTDNGWLVDIRPVGVTGKRIRKTFRTKLEAQRYETTTRSKADAGADYLPSTDKRRLTDLIELWQSHHGESLKSSADRVRRLNAIADRVGNPVARLFTPQTWADYRAKRLGKVKASTLNHEQAFLHAVFSELSRLGLWRHGNPLATMRSLRVNQSEMAYLDADQISHLLDSLHSRRTDHAWLISVVCLSTGCRWSEAETLRGENVRGNRITFVDTKSGKSRTVPISADLSKRLRKRATTGRLFVYSYKTFQRAFADTGIVLPKGQLTHVLRHTFASHFMMNGGNILVLQRILGHQSITMTMRYAHFAPDHLEEAVKLNPLAKWAKSGHQRKKPPIGDFSERLSQ